MTTDPLEDHLAALAWPPTPPDLARRAIAGATRRRRHVRVGQLATLAAAVFCVACVALEVWTPVGSEAASLLPPGMRQWFGVVTGAPSTLPPAGAHRSSLPPKSEWPSCSSTPRDYSGPCKADLTLAQVQARMPFTVQLPAGLPASAQYTGGIASVHGSAAQAQLMFIDGTGHIQFSISSGTVGGTAAPSSAVTQVDVGSYPGAYVKGDYEEPGGPGTAAIWTATADVEEVSWSQNGLTYDLIVSGLGLTQAQVLAIAATVP